MTVAERGYLSIGEVLSLLQEEFSDVTISKIRFLESQGLIDPERTPSGYRKFYETDIERLRFILREQKERFLPLKVIKDRLEGSEGDDVAAPGSDGEAEASEISEAGEAGKPGPDPLAAAPVSPPAASAPMAAPAAPAERVPAWLQPKAKPAAPAMASLGALGTGASFTFDELAIAAGLDPHVLADVERYGLVAGRPVGPVTYYDEDALVVARAVAGFQEFGVEPRHLRHFRNSADREAALIEQVILPLVKQRNPQARAQALTTLAALIDLGGTMRERLVRDALRSYTDGR